MLGGTRVKQIYDLQGAGYSIRTIATRLDVARNTVRKYLRAPEVPKPVPRPARSSLLDPYKPYLQGRLAEGLDNAVVLLRELRARGYEGGYTILKDYLHPLRRPKQPVATMRYETRPGEQAQVDFGYFRYQTPEGLTRMVWAFVLVLSWSRAIYVEFVRRADTAAFIRCHLNAFEYLGGIPARCLYDNAKVVVLERDAAGEPVWNPRFLDFSLRLGFGVKLCHPYRPQTKGRVESGVKYLRGNFWPEARFTDLADLNRQGLMWCSQVANERVHGTTREQPAERLRLEQRTLSPLPQRERLTPFLREERKVGRDGFVAWDGGAYGVPWQWAGKVVQVQASGATVELWSADQRLAVHPRAVRRGQRFTVPGQWAGLIGADPRPRREALAQQLPTTAVEQRPLAVYQALAEAVS
jgi:transposase